MFPYFISLRNPIGEAACSHYAGLYESEIVMVCGNWRRSTGERSKPGTGIVAEDKEGCAPIHGARDSFEAVRDSRS